MYKFRYKRKLNISLRFKQWEFKFLSLMNAGCLPAVLKHGERILHIINKNMFSKALFSFVNNKNLFDFFLLYEKQKKINKKGVKFFNGKKSESPSRLLVRRKFINLKKKFLIKKSVTDWKNFGTSFGSINEILNGQL